MRSCASFRHRGVRTVAAREFFRDALAVDLAEDEIVTEITLPKLPPNTGWGFEEVARRSGDFALAAVAATLTSSDGAIAQARIAMTGVAPTPRRAAEAEKRCSPARRSMTASATTSSRRCAPQPSRRPTCTPRRIIAATWSACWPAARSPPHGSARDRMSTRDISVTVNGTAHRHAVEPRLLLSDFLRAHARPHRHACRLRARRLRRLHGAARRRQRARLPDVRRAGGRLPPRDGRRPRPDRPAECPAAVVPRTSRAAMRLLHARHADDGDGPA